ncbi:hypothetical protein QR680_000871 [Steinernema hermaphroditum]|uniref:Homeobox domain-containing protein n=1 Tax=Steinernema hermaphroditum TaxID=289476 RepID=A0AA39GWX2_9BILA|nr:hypothetical protein QR680_000871 [Steinernema hermaphroditum]
MSCSSTPTGEVSQVRIDKKKRRVRTSFARWQLEILEREFHCQQYIVGQQRIELAARLDLNELQVKIWFQNRRIKWRREMLKGNCAGASNTGRR